MMEKLSRASPPLKAMSITRARTGCHQCRQRKKKVNSVAREPGSGADKTLLQCDERKPNCTACLRLGLPCELSKSSFRFVNESPSNRKSRPPGLGTHPPQSTLPVNASDGCESTSSDFSDQNLSSGVTSNHATGEQDLLPEANRAASGALVGTRELSTVELWFSSFVDFNDPIASTRIGSSLGEIGVDPEPQDEEYSKLQERLYLHHWRQNVVTELPGAYQHIEDLVNGCSALRSAIIALSACDLAQMHVEVRCYTLGHSVRWDYGMNRAHERDARNWYNKATRELGKMKYDKQEKVAVLATLLLFVHIEFYIGSFRGTAFHHHGIEHLLGADDKIWKNSVGKRLISAWVSARSQNWSCRVPFTLLGFEKTLGRLGVNVDLALDPSEARDEAVTVIMLQSWYLSLMVLFERYTGRGDMETISSRCFRDIHQRIKRAVTLGAWRLKDQITDEDYGELLQQQRMKLDKWYATLPLSQLPIELTNAESETCQSPQLDISLISSCLKFHSQRAAIIYAYYIVARIVQSSEILDEYLTMEYFDKEVGKVSIEANHWLYMLVQVVSSLEIPKCVRYCTYAVGLCELIRMCQLRLPRHSATICSLSDHLVKSFAVNCIPTDGHVLVSNFNYELKEIEEQRSRGRDLFYIIPRFSPDTALKANPPDFTTSSAVVYGRDRASGKLFCDVLSSNS